MKKTKRADNILDFIDTYPGRVLSYNKIEKMAGITPGRLSHYKHGRSNCGLGPNTLSKLERTLEVYGFAANPERTALLELFERTKRHVLDTSDIAEEILESLQHKKYITALGEVTAKGANALKNNTL